MTFSSPEAHVIAKSYFLLKVMKAIMKTCVFEGARVPAELDHRICSCVFRCRFASAVFHVFK